ncbi:MAG: thioredoxin family protein, partial [Alphaproteobacteria bacterium]
GPALGEALLTPAGLHTQSWFHEGFLELGDDLKEATQKGKRLAIIWEQRGCPYCRETHLVNFAQPEIQNFIKANFLVVQLNRNGDREVTDFDGTKLTEKELAQKYRVTFTPTVQFFPTNRAAIKAKAKHKPDVARMTGYYRPLHFLAMFNFVHVAGYKNRSFRKYLNGYQANRARTGKPLQFK